MKTIGMIGGMSWESSKTYYEEINRQVQKVVGGSHSCKSIMVSVDFADIERLTFEGKWDQIGNIMATSAKQLESAGADLIILCTNTIHLVSEAITQSTNIPFLHIADTTGEAIRNRRLKKIGLLGTQFTMEKDFYKSILQERYELEVVIPSVSERKTIQEIIYKELVLGQINQNSKIACQKIIENLEEKGVEGIILGCTELPLLISGSDVAIPTFDTTKIHAHKAVAQALQAEDII